VPLTDAGENAGLARAAEIIADKAKEITTAMPSKKIPPTIRSFIRAGIAYVSAGGTGGQEAPNAYMFETEGARHPLFGNKRHWYDQPFRPFLEEAAEIAGDDAAEAYADITIGVWAKESGYK
jgi:hypothetical protein